MAFEPGGYADKLGNRYEGRWVVKQLLRLLNEELTCVTIEAVGAGQQGVDLWIGRHDGRRQAQQCKARNASRDTWALSDLKNRGILAAMRRQLDRDDSYEFALISALPAHVLGDICESARQSSGDPEAFFRDQIQEIGESRRKAFEQFCACLGLEGSGANGRADAYGYLRRMYLILWSDDQNAWDDLLARAGTLATGKPEAIVASLAEYAQSNLRKTIVCTDVREHLASLGHHPRRLGHDARIAPAVEELRRQFDGSIAPGLVAGELIAREQTPEVLDAVDTNGVVVLHGPAGCGKTGVLYELTQMLREQGRAYIAVRLDRREPRNTPRQFGKELGLPESPALCLASLEGKQTSVLILDQLDALRWTSAHSANALDVCKSLIREVRNLRDLGKAIGVVLACRTFDLDHDPELRNWLKGSPDFKIRRVEVKSLPETVVKRVVEKFGRKSGAMSLKQMRILRSPQHLAMWVELASSGELAGFRTSVQLTHQFWASRYCELAKAGVSASQADEVIDRLTRHMERTGRVSAPSSLVADRPRELEAMHSHGLLHTTRGQVSFCHQSYLDFRIATRLLREVHEGRGTVRAWLGDKSEQSLFRREQLRQILSLISEESPGGFLRSVREILTAREVRFHLKHLVLELVGQIENPDGGLLAWVRSLLGDGYWKDHLIDTVFVGHAPYVRWLAREGVLGQWAGSGGTRDVAVACWLLRSVADEAPDFVSEFLEPYAARDEEWGRRALGCLCLAEQHDSDRMFDLRLGLARRGIAKDWVSWPPLAAKHPLRAIRLIEAVASTWTVAHAQSDRPAPGLERTGRADLEQWSHDDLEALIKVAVQHPEYVWDHLMPHIERLTAVPVTDHPRIRAWQDGERVGVYPGYTGTARGMVVLVMEAGRKLAQSDPAQVLTRTRPVQNSASLITQCILAEVYAALPAGHADQALAWLMGDPVRLRLGSGRREPAWMPAVRLIGAHSPDCSKEVFRRLEEWLVHYRDPRVPATAEWCLKDRREGRFWHFWGHAQLFLLPALCPARRLNETSGLIGVLERKFAGYQAWQFLRSGHTTTSFIGSALPGKKLEYVSDKSWLDIVTSQKVPPGHGRWRTQVGRDAPVESSVLMFSRDLARLARRFPDRFARLALEFPADVHPDYAVAALEGLKATQPNGVPEAEKAGWRAATMGLTEAVLARFGDSDDRGVACAFSWVLRNRADENWSGEILDRLTHYAAVHPDPEPGMLMGSGGEKDRDVCRATVEVLVENAQNCVRGVAALAVGALLSHHHDWVDRLRPCLGQLVSDPHPAVRTAAIQACLPVLDIDRDEAIRWFCAACKDDLRAAASPGSVAFFNCGMESHARQLAPIIQRMLASTFEEVVLEGAKEVAARWLFHGMFEDELGACRQGSACQRKGVAWIASHFLLESEYADRCEDLLLPLYQDEDQGVRAQTRYAFLSQNVFSLPNAPAVVARYIRSKAFQDDPSPVLWALRDLPGALTPFAEVIFMICEVFASCLQDASRDMATSVAGDAHRIPPLLLRLYDQAQEQEDPLTVRRCLDAWDLLFENRVGLTRDLTRAIDR